MPPRRGTGGFLLDRLGLWRAVRVSHPGDCPFPCRRRCMRRRSSPGRDWCRRTGRPFPFSAWVFRFVPSSESATRTGTSTISTNSFARIRAACAFSATPAEEVVPLRPGLRRRDLHGHLGKADRASTSSISDRRVRDRERFGRSHQRHLGWNPPDLHRRRARLGRRQPVHLPRYDESPQHGVEPKLSIRESLEKTIAWLVANPAVLERK